MKTPRHWVLAPLLGALTVCLAIPAAAAGPLLGEYTIYGENGVVIGFDSDIVGLVGARNNDPAAGNTAVRLNGKATVDGDVRSGGNVNLQNQASISGTVFRPAGTTLVLNSGSSVGTDAFPVDPMLPTLPGSTAFACPTGGAPLSGGNNQALPLGPGSYGALNFGGGFDLTLTAAGDYFFDSINAGNGSTLTVTQPGTRVFVCGSARWGSVNVTTAGNTPCDFYLETNASGDNAFLAGGNSNWVGDVFAPNGEIHIGSGGSVGSFIGRLFSNVVDIEHAIAGGSVNCDGPPPGDEQVFRSNKDATIFHTRKNQNNGAALTLRVERQTRSVLGFDVSQVDFAAVTSAKLTVTVSDNGFDVPPYSPSSGWPLGGGETYVARMDDGFETWAEGNGNNYPTPKNPRGTGAGVTWNCSTDNNIANEKPDCVGIFRWKTGGKKHQGPLRGPALHTDGMLDGTKVVFDVTADVLAGLGPQDAQFMSWFIQVKGLGSVAYYSREGALAAGDLSLAPTLLIEE
jgi:hypothetical protein